MEDASKSLYAYSLIRTLAEGGQDYIDALTPLVVQALATTKQPQTIDGVQSAVTSAFGMQVPQQSLQIVVTRAKRKGLLRQSQKLIGLTDSGSSYIQGLETTEAVTRRVREVGESGRAYLRDEFGMEVSTDDVVGLLEGLLTSNVGLAEAFAANQQADLPKTNVPGDLQAAFLRFLGYVESSQPSLYQTVVNLVRGSLVATALYSPSLGEVGRRFSNPTLVFLDTNVLLSLFEFHYEFLNRPTLELHELLAETPGIDLKVFDFTLDEFVGVLAGYAKWGFRYSPRMRVNSVYSSLRAKGWNSIDVREFIVNIEERLHEKGITVHPTMINLATFQFGDLPAARLDDYKPNQPDLGRCHDLAAIESIRSLRKRTPLRLEDAEALFLTADMRLARFDHEEMGHRRRGSIGEVLPDRLLTTMLWLKRPARLKALPLGSVIALYSHDLLIDREVWERFFELVERMRREDALGEGDVSLLLYAPVVEGLLLRVKRSDEITADWVRDAVQAGKAGAEQEAAARAADEERRFLETEATLKKEGIEGVLSKIASVKQGIRTRSAKDAERGVKALWIGVTALLVVLAIVFSGFVNRWLTGAALLGTIFVWWLGLVIDFKRIPLRVQDWLFRRLFSRRLAHSALPALEEDIKQEAES